MATATSPWGSTGSWRSSSRSGEQSARRAGFFPISRRVCPERRDPMRGPWRERCGRGPESVGRPRPRASEPASGLEWATARIRNSESEPARGRAEPPRQGGLSELGDEEAKSALAACLVGRPFVNPAFDYLFIGGGLSLVVTTIVAAWGSGRASQGRGSE